MNIPPEPRLRCPVGATREELLADARREVARWVEVAYGRQRHAQPRH